jgi:hypothetical protein
VGARPTRGRGRPANTAQCVPGAPPPRTMTRACGLGGRWGRGGIMGLGWPGMMWLCSSCGRGGAGRAQRGAVMTVPSARQQAWVPSCLVPRGPPVRRAPCTGWRALHQSWRPSRRSSWRGTPAGCTCSSCGGRGCPSPASRRIWRRRRGGGGGAAAAARVGARVDSGARARGRQACARPPPLHAPHAAPPRGPAPPAPRHPSLLAPLPPVVVGRALLAGLGHRLRGRGVGSGRRPETAAWPPDARPHSGRGLTGTV